MVEPQWHVWGNWLRGERCGAKRYDCADGHTEVVLGS